MHNLTNDYKLSYRAKMRDPRWIAFRAKLITERDCRCQECGCELTDGGGSVHHVAYIRGKEPWEYTGRLSELLLVLCWPCHQDRQANDEEAQFEFARLLAQLKTQSVYEMARGLRDHANGGAGGSKLYDAFETIRSAK